jgi:hypothetical protein
VRLEPRAAGPRRGVVLAALALAVLLGLVALASRGGEGAGGGGDGGGSAIPPSLLAYLYAGFVVCGALAVPLLLYIHAVETKRSPGRRRRRRWLLPIVLVAAVALSLVVGVRLADRLAEVLGELGLLGDDVADGAGAARGVGLPAVEWTPVAVVSSVVVACAGGVAAGRRLRRRSGVLHPLTAARLSTLLAASLDELRSDADPRRAVIRAYAAMERELARCGAPRRQAEAPLEYLGRALREVRVSAGPALALTELFERARFSRHPIDRGMQREAIAALEAVRRDLEGAG